MDYSTLDGNKLIQHLSVGTGFGMFIFNKDFIISEWNRYMEECTSILQRDIRGRAISEVFSLNKQEGTEYYRKALAGESFRLEDMLLSPRKAELEPKKLDLHFFPLEGEKAIEQVMVFGFCTDYAGGKKPRNLMQATLKTINDFLRFAPIPVFIVDTELNIKLANKAFNKLLNVKSGTGTISTLKDFVPSDLYEHFRLHVERVINGGQPLLLTEEYKLPTGRRYFYTIFFPVENSYGATNSIGGYIIDLTKEVEQQEQNKILLSETLRLNEMLHMQNQALQQSKTELDSTNKALQEQKQDLQQLVEELSDRNYELDQIMYKTSHDLRSPLTSILGLLMLARQETDVAKIQEYHTYIENRVHKLDDFVKAMLSYAKSSRTEITLGSIEWDQLLDDALEHVHYLEHFSRINKQVNINTELYSFQSDRVRVSMILNNLIGNAIKYADLRKPEPYVHVTIHNTAKGASIEVEDNGIGISQEYIDRVWDMFFRATDRSEGSGLGLYIVKQTVERLKGKIHIESQEGKGTSVVVFLPHLTRQQRLKTIRPNKHTRKKDI
ncbi:PAS domain-containing sensor histidine kinase [Cesiribacter sp. SM1]|uniref:PAS domain-containing sensor histidine kinase n=1 Tax=Cesiribacter sp. SM1 TaxID=2861196 RepID=UPI001CD81732|nr:PAS domain-containing sensor histidine kinase [Cesiribacter sp. SM1]